MRVFYELGYTVIIELVRTFYPKGAPAMFQKYSKHISWVIRGTSSSKLSCNPRYPGISVATIVTICCNHRDGEYFLHRITRKLGSTATPTVITGLLPLTDYIYLVQKMSDCGLCQATPTEILKCAHRRPRPWWRWLQLQSPCGFPHWLGGTTFPGVVL